MTIIEADGVETESLVVEQLTIFAGKLRYAILINVFHH